MSTPIGIQIGSFQRSLLREYPSRYTMVRIRVRVLKEQFENKYFMLATLLRIGGKGLRFGCGLPLFDEEERNTIVNSCSNKRRKIILLQPKPITNI